MATQTSIDQTAAPENAPPGEGKHIGDEAALAPLAITTAQRTSARRCVARHAASAEDTRTLATMEPT